MTIADLAPVIEYLEDGVSLNFPVPFRFLAPGNLAAWRTLAGVQADLVYGVDYFAVGGATDSGGTLTLLATVAGAILHIERQTPLSQDADYQTNDRFPAETHEGVLDKLMAIAQEQKAGWHDLDNRALKVPPGETVEDLPPASVRAQGIQGYDQFGQPIILPSAELGSVAVVAQRTEYIAVAGQTLFMTPAQYTVGYVSVYVNGVRLSEQEFIATNGSNVVLIEPAAEGDVVALEAFLGSAVMGSAGNFIFTQWGAGNYGRSVEVKLYETVSITDFPGADKTGATDSTAAIVAAISSGATCIRIPRGTFLFSTFKVPRNIRLSGDSGRSSILKHTGTGAAIVCEDASTIEPDGSVPYIESGWRAFDNFTLLMNGDRGIVLGETRTSFTNIDRLYIRHRRDLAGGDPNNQYFPGSIAIDCSQAVNNAVYIERIHHCFIRGVETGIRLKTGVNAWTIRQNHFVECKVQILLDGATGIHIENDYFESGVAAARGIVFAAGGGNQVNVRGSTFEFTNAAQTQYAYDFAAGGAWDTINVEGCKYLIAGDGGAVNARRIIGAAPSTFVEAGRTYTSATFGVTSMLWAPSASAAKPFQLPNFSRIGGFQQGNGQLRFGRTSSDASDIWIDHDGVRSMVFRSGNGGFQWTTTAATPILVAEFLEFSYHFQPGNDGGQNLGAAAKRWATIYASVGTINTSDGTEKQQIEVIPDSWLDAWAGVEWRRFKFNAAIEVKGAGARWHTGLIAQQVHAAFAAQGIDAFTIGLCCYDEWQDDGETRVRWGVRYDECHAIEAAWQRRELARLRALVEGN